MEFEIYERVQKISLLKFATAIIVSVLFSNLLINNSYAAGIIKPGEKCKVLNQKITIAKTLYICEKYKNSGVWKKIPNSSSSIGSANIFKTVNQPIYTRTFNYLTPGPINELDINIEYSPKVNRINADKLTSQIEESLKYFIPHFGSNKKFTLVFMNENEKDWYSQQVTRFEGSINDDWWGGTHCLFNSFNECGRGSNIATENILYEMVGSNWQPSQTNIFSPYHEAVHVYQKSIIGNGMYRVLPPWFGEGNANFLGFVTSSTVVDINGIRKQQILNMQRLYPVIGGLSADDWLKEIYKTETDFNYCFSNGLGYSLGMLINEYLYSIMTPNQIDQILSLVNSGISWDIAIEKTSGEAKASSYKAASTYIVKEIQKSLN